MSHRKDNYNEVYQELISEGFLDTIGQGAINGVKGIGKGISKLWKWGKNKHTKNQMNSNIAALINTSIETFKTAEQKLTHIDKDIISDNAPTFTDKRPLQDIADDINKITSEINEVINTNKELINSTLTTLDTALPNTSFKPFYKKIQELGSTTGNNIIQNKLTCKNQEQIETSLKQTINTLIIELKNNYLKKSLTAEEAYFKAYLDILQEDINDTNITINANGDTSVPANATDPTNLSVATKPLIAPNTKDSSNSDEQPVDQVAKPENKEKPVTAVNDEEYKMRTKIIQTFNNIKLCIAFYTLTIIVFSNILFDVIKETTQSDSVLKKIFKNDKNDKTNNISGFKFDNFTIRHISEIYYTNGLLSAWKNISEVTIK